MALVLEYADKYRLWSGLIQGNADRVFVRTDETPPVGAAVPVTLALPGLPLQIIIEGTVVGRRPGGARFAAGAYVRFAADQIDRCRRFLGLGPSPGRHERGRQRRRVRCELRLELVEPRVEAAGAAKNLSEEGLLLAAPCELAVGQQVEARLLLDDGAAVDLRAEVSWARNDKRLVGLRFRQLEPDGDLRLRAALTRLESAATRSPRPQVLVADDEPNVLEFLTRALARHGYDVRKASRGEEALDLVRQLHPELVILDILMPGMDGVDVCKMMRADVEMADIPVVFLSALEPARLHQVADEAGATDYLTKPVNLADLVHLVSHALKR